MNNAQIADTFDHVADLLEFQGANPFRIRAYRNGARTIRDLAEPLAALVDNRQHPLTDIPGIGTDLAEKCVSLLQTGQLPLLEELRAAIPPGVLEVMRVPGLGPKKAALLHRELGIGDLQQLELACREQKVRQLKGFGAKSEQAILDGIPLIVAAAQRMRWADADRVAHGIREHMQRCPAIEQLAFAGSYRRGRETVGDLDLLTVSADAATVMDCLAECPDVTTVIARGPTKMSVRVHHGLQVDLRVVPAPSFGAALQYFTGSKQHNVVVRTRAKARGLKINEYGVFRMEGDHEVPVAGATEADVYAALGLPCFPPELREARQEFVWAEAGTLPVLVTLEDIRGDLHMHTTASDGKGTVAEMVASARRRGWEYIAITDHSQRVSMARGLDGQRLRQQWHEIDACNRDCGDGFLVLKGVECDILEKGGMDLPDDVLAEANWVLASIHYGQKQSSQQITERLLEAIEHPYVSAIAHPTGRLISRREPYEFDWESVWKAAKQHGKCLELNANPERLDLDDVHCAAARSAGIPVVINSDAHSPAGMDVMAYGILQARRGGLTRPDVVNTRSWSEIRELGWGRG